ncbi:MAG: hypothetical protein J6O04_05925 [Selenomonadaceae bacterium]|nr:hypothetical protein [Selenomonadaceae bacterium]
MNSVLDKVIAGMKTVRSGQFAHFFDIEKNGDVSLTSKNYSTKSNNSEVIGISDAGYVEKAREEYIEMFARGEATLNKGFGYGESHG